MLSLLRILVISLVLTSCCLGQETHSHGVPEKLGKAHFPTSCAASVQQEFDRGVALLHSFAYRDAENAFKQVAQANPQCAMAHWGIAMTYFHQLWEPQIAPASVAAGQSEIQKAQEIGARSDRESGFVSALSFIYEDAPDVPYRARAAKYVDAMKQLASRYKDDVETQVFYALALLANVSPADKSHARQKEAAAVLELCYPLAPEHPGIPHYLIHAYDNAELAPKGITAARAYSQIAPSAPHALHMPSHIFTRLGLWADSISSNIAAREAAHKHGDIGEELHAMDYLVYAYIQASRDDDALAVIQQLKSMSGLKTGEFKVAYAATAMPVRYAMERQQWSEAAAIEPPTGSPPQVIALAIWARGVGLARTVHSDEARKEAEKLQAIETELVKAGNDYWATQARILSREVMAWAAQSENKPESAVALLRQAADEEDAIEKLPVTPGPIVPAREQLGDLLLQQKHPDLALAAFKLALLSAPGRRGALRGQSEAVRQAPAQRRQDPQPRAAAGNVFQMTSPAF